MPPSKSSDQLLPGDYKAVITGTPAHDVAMIEVLEETLVVGKRLVETGHAKVHVTVSERDEAVETLLMRQDLNIDRVRIDRRVDVAPPVRQEGDTIIVSLVEERVVTEKKLFLTEELRIRIDQTHHTETQTVRLRREQAEIDQHATPNQPSTQGTTK